MSHLKSKAEFVNKCDVQSNFYYLDDTLILLHLSNARKTLSLFPNQNLAAQCSLSQWLSVKSWLKTSISKTQILKANFKYLKISMKDGLIPVPHSLSTAVFSAL